MPNKASPAPELAKDSSSVELRSVAKTLSLPSGLFSFSVKSASPQPLAKGGDLQFPALHVAPGPGCAADLVEFVGSSRSMGTWLYRQGDRLVVKIQEPGATLVLSSIRTEGSQPLEVSIEPVAGTSRVVQPPPALAASPKQEAAPQAGDGTLKLQLNLHIRNYGDLSFTGPDWAGLLAENMWIEAIGVVLLEGLNSRDLEYKSLSANGFESPWTSDGALSGTRGRSTPLVGIAIRLRPEAATQYDCEYDGYFQSGVTIGPVRNGVPCRSRMAGDPLVGLKLRITKRAAVPKPAVSAPAAAPAVAAAKGPKFGNFRLGKASPAAAEKAVDKKGKAKPAAEPQKTPARAAAKSTAKPAGRK